jgi:geranylgeranylglycerol-phosphate geranylgeranyltransferase
LVFNDYFDYAVDCINAPQRPLPSGLVTRRDVIALGTLITLVGLVAAWSFSPLVFLFSLLVWLCGFLYNWKLKAAGLVGNLIVCASVAMTFLLGGLVTGKPLNGMVWTFSAMVFCFDLAEEIAADAMDAEGDEKRGSRSIAILYGKRAALRVSSALFGLVIVLSFLPFALGNPGLAYLLPILCTDGLILFFVYRLLKSQTITAGRRWIRALYISGSIGLLAFLLGAFL